MLTGSHLSNTCAAVLNSTLITLVPDQKITALNSGMGVRRDGSESLRSNASPIPKISAAAQRPFIRLVDEILEAKAADLDADTSYLEWDIDRLVYDLYGLTEEEDTAIERSLGLIHQTDEEEDAATVKWIMEGRTGEYVSKEVVMETLRNPHGG